MWKYSATSVLQQSKLLNSIKYLIFRTIPKIISAGSILGFFPKVDIRYYSNKKIYKFLNKKINKF